MYNIQCKYKSHTKGSTLFLDQSGAQQNAIVIPSLWPAQLSSLGSVPTLAILVWIRCSHAHCWHIAVLRQEKTIGPLTYRNLQFVIIRHILWTTKGQYFTPSQCVFWSHAPNEQRAAFHTQPWPPKRSTPLPQCLWSHQVFLFIVIHLGSFCQLFLLSFTLLKYTFEFVLFCN